MTIGNLLLTSLLLASLLSLAVMGSRTVPAQEGSGEVLRVMSYNIRYNNPDDGINAWPHRKDHVAQLIRERYPSDLAGLQEALFDQIEDLASRLPEHRWIGKGRDDGLRAGEFSPIFYRSDRFELLEENTFWLSETPEVPGSKSWDAAITRIVTWGKFQSKPDSRVFYVFNTHFDHRGQQARIESARLLRQRIREVAGRNPVIVTGDLNVTEASEAYRILTSSSESETILQDARYASRSGHRGPTASFNNWVELRPPESRIDFIFVANGVQVLSHLIADDRFDGRFPSDHLPVLAEVRLP